MIDSFELRYYRMQDGQVPYREWLETVTDPVAYAAVQSRMDRLMRGLFGDCKPSGEGVWELRIDTGLGYRVYYARSGKQVVLLLCGGDKRRQSADIERAKNFWRDYGKRIRFTVGTR